MDSNAVRAQIQDAIAHEERTGNVAKTLTQHLAANGVSFTPQQQAECLGFIRAYVSETPDIMDAAYVAARQAGVLGSIQPIFDTAFQYWALGHDYIPDHLGLIGLTDDAYLTRMFLESISNLHRQQTGGPLLAVDLGPANRMMRGLIGEPLASQLDAVVGQTVAAQAIQVGMQQLAAFTGGLNFGMPNLGAINQYEIDRAVDVRLGAMGVV